MSRLVRIFLLLALLGYCREIPKEVPISKWEVQPKLSQYPFFQRILEGNQNELRLVTASKQELQSISYELNSPLFSDFMEKERIIFLPRGAEMGYEPELTFSFPNGAIISKTFRIGKEIASARYPMGKRIETRLLIKREDGWFAVSYVWQDDEKEATIAYGGATVSLKEDSQSFQYAVPSRNQCAQCHQVYENDKQVIVPIGPKAKHLNRTITWESRNGDEQLAFWKKEGILANLPFFGIPALPDYRKESFSGEERGRAYLDINCAHCHQANASGGMNSKLLLNYEVKDSLSLGICKQPGSAGKGGGDQLKYDIVPGKPDESILAFRLETTIPGAMMPQLGRSLSDPLGVALVRAWIQKMPEGECRF